MQKRGGSAKIRRGKRGGFVNNNECSSRTFVNSNAGKQPRERRAKECESLDDVVLEFYKVVKHNPLLLKFDSSVSFLDAGELDFVTFASIVGVKEKISEAFYKYAKVLQKSTLTVPFNVFKSLFKLCCALAKHGNVEADDCKNIGNTFAIIGSTKYIAADVFAKGLKIFEEIIPVVEAKYLPSLLEPIVGEDGVLRHFKYSSDREFYEAAIEFYQTLLNPTNLGLLKLTYEYVCKNLLACKARLEKMKKRGAFVFRELKDIEAYMTLLLASLRSIVVVKNSLNIIGLQPTLFQLLVEDMPIDCEWFLRYFPTAHYSLLVTAKMHFVSREFFVANSQLISANCLPESAIQNNLSLIFTKISNVLNSKYLADDAKRLVIQMVFKLVLDISPEQMKQIIDLPNVISARKAILDCFLSHGLNFHADGASFSSGAKHNITVMKKLSVFSLIDSNGYGRSSKFVENCVVQSRDMPLHYALEVWRAIPPALFVRNSLKSSSMDVFERQHWDGLKIRIDARVFVTVTSLLLDSVVPLKAVSHFESGDTHWLSFLSHDLVCAAADSKGIVKLDSSSKWRWILAQVAAYCVENRMKTPYGRPQDTFAKFEGAIRGLAAVIAKREKMPSFNYRLRPTKADHKAPVLRKKPVDDDVDYREEGETREKASAPLVLSSAEDWWRVRMLLELVENLDKMMVTVFDGAVVQLMEPSQECKKFFVANNSTCSTWMSRMSIPLLSVSFHNGYFAQTIRIATNVLRDLERHISSDSRNESIENAAVTVIGWTIRSMIELGDDQSIAGMRVWCDNFLGCNAKWIGYAACLAKGQVEDAVRGFRSVLDDGVTQVVRSLVSEMLLRAHRCIRDSENLKASWEYLLANAVSTSGTDTISPFESRCNRLRALTEWEPMDDYNSKVLNKSAGWDFTDKLDDYECRLISLSNNLRKGAAASRYDSEDLLLDFSEEVRMVFFIDSVTHHCRPSSIYQKLRFVVQKANLDKSRTRNGFMAETKLDPFDEFNSEDVLLKGLKGTEFSVLHRLAVAQEMSVFLEPSFDQTTSDASYADFYLTASRLGRKTGNLDMAKKHLTSLFVNSHSPFASPYPWPQCADRIINGLVPPTLTAEEYLLRNLKVLTHAIKMEYDKAVPQVLVKFDCHCNAFSFLAKVVSNYVERRVFESSVNRNMKPFIPEFDIIADALYHQFAHLAKNGANESARKRYSDVMAMNEVVSKACIQLGTWLQRDPGMYNTLYSQFSGSFWHQALHHHNHVRACSGLNGAESLVGALFSLATRIAPLGKCHKKLADWAVGELERIDPEANVPNTLLNSQERTFLRSFLNPEKTGNLRNEVLEAMVGSHTAAGFLGKLQELAKSTSSPEIDSALCDPQHLLMQIWTLTNERRNFLYEIAVNSYFSFLECGDPNGFHSISAVLCILQAMLTRHESLLPTIRERLQRSRDDIWIEILPQLFARLNHKNSDVREALMSILERIAYSFPHSVCYQAVVGAENNNEDSKKIILKSEDEIGQESNGSSFVSRCCNRLISAISRSRPKLVEDLRMFTDELQRINMLEEERWNIVLSNLDHEVMRRTKHVMREIAKSPLFEELTAKEKTQLLGPKWSAYTKPIYKVLNDLFKRTCESPTTQNEKSFVKHHSDTLRIALKQFEKNMHDLPSAWRPFKQFLDILNHRASKRSAMLLSMEDISPSLSELAETTIPIPGQERMPFDKVMTIHKVGSRTSILPTKTRPKKLAFIGSDGKEYIFLFKGQEDLHLDERVMQFLRICNKMLHPAGSCDGSWPAYNTTNYSVTPLGQRSGLIQWVEGGTPIYQMYRKHKNRQVAWNRMQTKEKRGVIKMSDIRSDDANKSNKKVERSAVPLSLTENERPTDIFLRKLKAVMAERKITYTTDRSKWPEELMIEVLNRLIKETPRDLLAREMWLRSGNSETWWRVTQRFARSSAVMSIIGYIIGLGDRHLDNILVNLSTGNIIHIDYNVCFEKGRSLRVPETVPFRLTGNIAHALGPTNIEGVFRESCVHVMKTLREGKRSLIAILDAFVYDPLVDWTTQDSVASSTAVNIATMFAVYGKSQKTHSLSTSHESNNHALNIARVVRLKLEGYNAMSHQFDERAVKSPSSPGQQVDALIKEAADPANLAMMYEGWTSWV
ncbi:hypothetical protein QR680_009184 [Steinernema hermaphroditum]|uniref:non-specific serine/threonine protein kinase n=1 Tax=Steinernema hermaphroditum TaxID=289476 RepID=A0AA39M9F5_9BILA|nr:hypothetical protein QR680_009184 [Steinernema hermaphroditum]